MLTVAVLLQAMRQPPAPDAKCRDKFLVQSVIITPDKEFTNVQNIVSRRNPNVPEAIH